MIIYMTNDNYIKNLANSLKNSIRLNERICHFDEFFRNEMYFTELNNQLPERLNFVGHGNLQQRFGAHFAEGVTGYDANDFANEVKKKIYAASLIYPGLKEKLRHINLIGCHLGLIDENSNSFALTVAERLSELNELGFKSLQVNSISNGFGDENASVALPLIHVTHSNLFFAYTFANLSNFNYFAKLIDHINLLIRDFCRLAKNIASNQDITLMMQTITDMEEFALNLVCLAYVDLLQQNHSNSTLYQVLQKSYQKIFNELFTQKDQLENIDLLTAENNNTIFLTRADTFVMQRSQQLIRCSVQSKEQQLNDIKNKLLNIESMQAQTSVLQQFFLQAFHVIHLFKEELQKEINELQTLNAVYTHDVNLTHEKFLQKCAAIDQIGEFFFSTNDIVTRLETNPDYNMTLQFQILMQQSEQTMHYSSDAGESMESEPGYESSSEVDMSSDSEELISLSQALTIDKQSRPEELNTLYAGKPSVSLLFSRADNLNVATLNQMVTNLKIR